jgi:hypothetical protein
MLSAPTRMPASSTTGNWLILCCSIISTASTASRSGPIERGCRPMMSLTDSVRRSRLRAKARRRSPSVTIPDHPTLGVTTAVMPMPPRDISRMASAGWWRRRLRNRRSDSHHVANMGQQATAERTARVGTGKIFGAKAARIEQGDRQRVTECQRGGGTGGRRQIERARFLRHRGVEVHVGLDGQRRLRIAGHADQLGALALDDRHDGQQLGTLARIGKRNQHIVAGDHPEVAMAGLGRMNEIGGGAGAGQRRSDLAPTWPDLPMPLTITRPRQLRISTSACRKSPSIRAASASTASASMRSTWRARSSAFAEGCILLMRRQR